MKVVHLSLSNDGGAGIAAYRLHTALRENGVDSMMLTLHSKNDDPTVKVINTTDRPCLSSGPGTSLQFYIYEQRRHFLMQQHPHRSSAYEVFTDVSSDIVLEDIPELQQADIINMHWVAGIVDSSRLRHSLRGKKIVWTLHAMNDFTGGCCYSYDCNKYIAECSNCPILGRNSIDYARYIFNQKLLGTQQTDITYVTPSKWLFECAKNSRIFGNHNGLHIANGIPVDVYRPYETTLARSFFGIAPDKFIILFGAFDSSNKRKGFHLLLDAVKCLPKTICNKISVVGFGAASEKFCSELPCEVVGIGSICNDENLALIYSLADLYIMPSMADNLPNSILEALSCGTPVVAFGVGGIPEIVRHEVNGYLASPFDVQDLANGIVWSLENRSRLTPEICTATIRNRFTAKAQAAAYTGLYQRLLTSRTDAAPPVAAPIPTNPTNRLAAFIDSIAAETYPEPPSTLHSSLTARAIEQLFTSYPIPRGSLVLDVGCGQGIALRHFVERGCRPVGITLNGIDLKECRKQGYTVTQMDQSFLDFEDATFDLVWARHVVEHSIFPYFTLTELARVLKPGGFLYLEVPAAESSCLHETNPNHYSILSCSMWLSLLERSGFQVLEDQQYFLKNEAGPDKYWAFFGKKQFRKQHENLAGIR